MIEQDEKPSSTVTWQFAATVHVINYLRYTLSDTGKRNKKDSYELTVCLKA